MKISGVLVLACIFALAIAYPITPIETPFGIERGPDTFETPIGTVRVTDPGTVDEIVVTDQGIDARAVGASNIQMPDGSVVGADAVGVSFIFE